jgi:hypothetical protein
MDYLIGFISRILTWLLDFVKWFAEWVYQEVMGALVGVLNAIPVPQFIQDAPSVLGALPGGIGWGLAAFKVPEGLLIVMTALLIRFFIRRLPIIG